MREAVKRRSDESFMALTFAATSGDIEEVRRILRRGAGVNDHQYDGRTVLHMAACQGNFRVVEALLEEGADVRAVDRWGNTALQDAINERQGLVAELLAQRGSVLNSQDPAGIMCDLASRGNVDTLKLVLENGVDPNLGDYDYRTALHLAAAEGQEKAVEYLVAKGADVNCKDRCVVCLFCACLSGYLSNVCVKGFAVNCAVRCALSLCSMSFWRVWLGSAWP